jgi:hypothetical protein
LAGVSPDVVKEEAWVLVSGVVHLPGHTLDGEEGVCPDVAISPAAHSLR